MSALITLAANAVILLYCVLLLKIKMSCGRHFHSAKTATARKIPRIAGALFTCKYMDTLPDELLHIVADFGAYYGLVCSYKRYAMLITPAVKLERLAAAGVEVVTSAELTEWKMYGYTHRVDGPAHIHCDGELCWYRWGLPHRVGGPAHIWPDGSVEWLQYGRHHREDGPAVEFQNFEAWFYRGLKHRVGGPAFRAGAQMQWYYYGMRHREDGPAEVSPTHRYWFYYDKLHREDGPAIEKIKEGIVITEHWINGEHISGPHISSTSVCQGTVSGNPQNVGSLPAQSPHE